MANWSVLVYAFGNYTDMGQQHTVARISLDRIILSGKLTLSLGDTSKLSVVVKYDDIISGHLLPKVEPVKSLIQVTYGNDKKFFGTISKITKDFLNGTARIDAVGVLGSYQFLPNKKDYTSTNTIDQVVSSESTRFLTGADSPWSNVFTPYGEGYIPSNFGKLTISQISGMIPSCNIEKVQQNSKNAYEFLKTITKKGNYVLPSGQTWGTWIENGEQATFAPISQTPNTQEIDYNANLISCTFASLPYKTKVNCFSDDGGNESATGTDYPMLYNYVRYHMPKKDDGSPYTSTELQHACSEHLAERDSFVEATAFDRHLIDETVPWLDMGKIVNLKFWDNRQYTTIQAQITQIVYDLVNPGQDRVKLGKIIETITESQGSVSDTIEEKVKEYLPLSGGTMTGSLSFVENGQTATVDANKLEIRERYGLTCNLLDSALIEQGDWDGSNPTIRCRIKVKVKASTTYTQSVSGCVIAGVVYLNSSGSLISFENSGATTFTFRTPSGCAYAVPVFKKSDDSAISVSDISNCQLEKGSQPSSYVPYTMDGVEVAKKCRGWRYRGILYNSAYFDDVNDTELMIVPKIYDYVFQSGHFLIDLLNTSASPSNEFCVRQDNSYGFVVTFHKSGNTIVLDSKTADGWDASQILLHIYTRA